MTDQKWPVADFDPVRQLRVIAATTPGATIHETVLPAPLDAVWAVAEDLEGELPRWVFRDLRSVTVTSTDDSDRLVARALGHSGLRARFDVVLRPGWCLMRSRFLLGGMAATAEGGVTRFALLSGLRGSLRFVAPATRPILGHISDGALVRFTERVQQRRH